MLGALSLPPAPQHATGARNPGLGRRTVAGAIHVHSTESDGTAPQAAIAGAAARAGLQFVVFTDHGDATRTPAPPAYLSGVLCLDAVEISTNSGHYVAIGLPKAPYRLGGEAAAVAEDVRRLGGFGVIAHPDSARRELAWHDWQVAADGIEWLNADSAWRSRSWPSLIRPLVGYWIRPGATLAAMLDRPDQTLDRWDATTAHRPMAALAALDAHGGVGRASLEGGRSGVAGIPSYEASFESFSLRAILQQPLTGDPAGDASALLDSLRSGRTYTVIDGVAAPGWVEVSAERSGAVATMGETLKGSGTASMSVRAASLPGTALVVLRNGVPVVETSEAGVQLTLSQPGAYRAEVRRRGAPEAAPWILANPIYIDLPAAAAPAAVRFTAGLSLLEGEWRTEHDPTSKAELLRTPLGVGMDYRLDPAQQSAFAALAVPVEDRTPFDAVSVSVNSDAPARLSIQFRSADGRDRWRTSFVTSGADEPVTLKLSDFIPVSPTVDALRPSVAASLLLVADLVNFTPGSQGRFLVHRLTLGRAE